MVAPAFASGTSIPLAYTQVSRTINKPSGVQPGDLLVVATNTQGTAPTLTVDGFTQAAIRSAGDELTVFTRVADGNEGATFTINLDQDAQLAAACARFTGVNTAAPIDTTSGADSGGNYWLERRIAGLTTSYADELLVGIIGIRQAPDTTAITGWTLNVNNSPNVLIYSKQKLTAGVEADTAEDQATVYDLWTTVTLALRSPVVADVVPRARRGALSPMGLR